MHGRTASLPQQNSLEPVNGPCRLLDLIGDTPLLDLSDLLDSPRVRLLAKAEFANPGGSVKDRPARAMVLDARERGLLGPGARILDATSGNTGIAYAMLGAAMGYGVTLCMASNVSIERQRILRAYGAECIFTDPLEGSDGAIREARRLAAESGGSYVYLDQYSNPENWRAHYTTTGPEIWRQTSGQISHFVAGLGTSGTFVGAGRYLRQQDPSVRLVSVEPDSAFHGLEGMKHMDSALVPAIYDSHLADEKLSVSTETAYAMVKRLARELGLLVGVSAGANVAVALGCCRRLSAGVVVTILCDGADRYLSESFWDET